MTRSRLHFLTTVVVFCDLTDSQYTIPDTVNKSAASLIRRMLQPDQVKRATIKDVRWDDDLIYLLTLHYNWKCSIQKKNSAEAPIALDSFASIAWKEYLNLVYNIYFPDTIVTK